MRNPRSTRFFVCGWVFLLPLMASPAHSRPTVVELFTSEGCSSCPPAEAYLHELASRADTLALSFHVDYWDDLGWPDPLALASSTNRQRAYARKLGLSSVFTPQVVLDGSESFVGSDRSRIGPRLGKSSAEVPLTLTRQGSELVIAIAQGSSRIPSDIVLIPFRRRVVSHIGRGENSGRTLEESNVAREVRVLGQSQGEPRELRVPLDSLAKDATDVAVLIQRPGQGEILGAASVDLSSTQDHPTTANAW
jgi:hypothetical protein